MRKQSVLDRINRPEICVTGFPKSASREHACGSVTLNPARRDTWGHMHAANFVRAIWESGAAEIFLTRDADGKHSVALLLRVPGGRNGISVLHVQARYNFRRAARMPGKPGGA